MRRADLSDLAAFLAVAEERSFTRAAAKLGTSQSALSHTIRALEGRLGLRLLTRTTRSVAPTEAGDRLMETLRPAFDDIDGSLAALTALREKPAGAIRINTSEHAAETVLWPALARLLPDYPDIKVELTIEHGFTDIVAGRYDAGVRLGEQVARDMIAVPIGPDMRMAVVGSPGYFAGRKKRQTPHDPGRTIAASTSAFTTLRRSLCLGVREERPRTEGAGRRPTGFQQWQPVPAGRAGRLWPGLCAGRPGHGACSRRRGWCAYWQIGARRFLASISTTPAAASTRQPSRCLWKRCAIRKWRNKLAPLP